MSACLCERACDIYISDLEGAILVEMLLAGAIMGGERFPVPGRTRLLSINILAERLVRKTLYELSGLFVRHSMNGVARS